jgi:hypothetical protein
VTNSAPVAHARLGRAATFLVWLVAVLDVLAILVPSLIALAGIAAAGEPVIWEVAGGVAIYALSSLYGVVGAVIATRQPRNRIGWLLWLGGTALALSIAGSVLGETAPPGASPIIDLLVASAGSMLTASLFLIVFGVPLCFPDGSLPSARWRYVAWYAMAGLVLTVVGPLLPPGRPAQTIADVANIVTVTAILAALLAMVLRFRRGDRVRRQQIKWVAAVAGVTVIGFGSAFVIEDGPGWMVGIIGMALLPVSIGIAVLRYRLYEIDRIISRTLSWALVTATLVAAFAALVIGLTSLLGSIAGGSTFAVAGATLAVFALFQPLRARIQRAVDRRFDRARYDAERTATAFAARLRDDVDLASVQNDLLGVVSRSLQPRSAGIWMRPDVGRPTP